MDDNLRSFRTSDADAVVELSRRAVARPELQVGNPVWTTREQLEAELGDWEPAAEETLLVAEEDGRVTGFGGVELPRGFTHAELFGPLVATHERGHGLGERLLEASIARARAASASTLVASVGTKNAAARILLERADFRAVGRPQATFRLSEAEHRELADAPPGIRVRLATQDDLRSALDLYHECFPQGRFPDDVWRENVEHETVYAAEHDDALVAVLNIDPSDRWIYHVGVTESERKRGVGAYLLSRSLRDYWERHPGETLGLDVDADNVAAIRLYRRQGFAPWLVLQAFELEL